MELIHTYALFAIIAVIAFNAMLWLWALKSYRIMYAAYSFTVNVIETYAVVTLNVPLLIPVLVVEYVIGIVIPRTWISDDPNIVERMTLPTKLFGIFLAAIITGIQYGAVALLSRYPL
ncbi:hypothetical protein HYV70_00585 [Candidatus Uhrbacteria bacterium]|nr:hypothetical protein [Candidatus Uhrbacteria bacterium]